MSALHESSKVVLIYRYLWFVLQVSVSWTVSRGRESGQGRLDNRHGRWRGASSYAGAIQLAGAPDAWQCVGARCRTRRTAPPRSACKCQIKLSNTAATVTAIVATEKRPIAAAESDVAVGSLRGAVVDLQIAVFQKTTWPTDSTPSGLFGRTSSQIPSRYLCSFAFTGTDDRWRSFGVSSAVRRLARFSIEYRRAIRVQRLLHPPLVRV